MPPLTIATRAPSRHAGLSSLAPKLDELYAGYNAENVVTDPIWIVRRFETREDREVVGFCAAALAFGRVQSVLNSIEGLLAVLGPSPAAYVGAFNPARDRHAFDHLVHRWTRGPDLAALVWVLRQMIETDESIEGFFARRLDAGATDVESALDSFSRRACKRLNLFLRWMVRHDRVDLGVWSRVRPSQLIVPLDTHVIRVGQCLGLTSYRSPGWRMAADITRSLRAIDPEDPVKYDFSLCHLGMMNACGFGRLQRDAQCPLKGACRPPKR